MKTSADRRLPMRQNPLREHRSSAVGLHVPLHRLSAFDEQRLLSGYSRRRPAFVSAAWSLDDSSAPPTVGESTHDGSAPNAGPGFAAHRGMA